MNVVIIIRVFWLNNDLDQDELEFKSPPTRLIKMMFIMMRNNTRHNTDLVFIIKNGRKVMTRNKF